MSTPDECLLEKLDHLVRAMQDQTEAIKSLAESNALLVQAMGEYEDEDGGIPTHYLDGSTLD